jgi:hypothetical protein
MEISRHFIYDHGPIYVAALAFVIGFGGIFKYFLLVSYILMVVELKVKNLINLPI